MTPYEQYLINDFKPYSMQNNPFEVGSVNTQRTLPENTKAQIQGELANKPAYNARGERYGSTLSDDMFDIKNGRRGETTKHPWVGGYSDYTANIPVLQPVEKTPIEQYLENNPYLNGKGDFRDTAISRKKNIGDGVGNLWAESMPEENTDAFWAGEDVDNFVNQDYAKYVYDLAQKQLLEDRINVLQGKESTPGKYDSIRDDMLYLKNNGNALHDPGDIYEANSLGKEYDLDPVFNYDPEESWGFSVNPDRLSPKTAEMIARSTTQDRPIYNDYWNEPSGLNPVINMYRRMLGLSE